VAHRSWPPQAVNFGFFFFCYYGYAALFMPYASLYFAERGMTAAQIGVLMSLMQIMRIFGPNLWGWVADRTGRRVSVLRATALASLVSAFGLLAAQSFLHFVVVMTLLNTFTSSQTPLSEALMLSEMRGDLTHYGPLRLWGSIGFIVLVTLGGKMFDTWGVSLMPVAAIGMLVAVCFASWRLRESQHDQSHRDVPSMAALLKRREVSAFFVSTFLMVAAHSALYVFYSLYLARIGYSKTVIGLMWSLGVIAEIVFFFYQAPIFRRISLQRLMIASLLIGTARFLMIGLGAESLVLLVAAQLLHAVTFGVHHSASVATLQRWFAGPMQARGQALYTSISYGLGGTAGGLVMSMFWDTFGPRAVYLAASISTLAGAAAAALSFRWQSHRKEI
jgi:PPP family 3-phenylpropionic acid transporter